MSEVTPTSSSAVTQKRRGLGAAIGGALAALTGALVGGTSKIFGEVANRGGTALAGFRARPEHSRWRAYALGSYGVLFAGTLAAQLWSANPLGVPNAPRVAE